MAIFRSDELQMAEICRKATFAAVHERTQIQRAEQKSYLNDRIIL